MITMPFGEEKRPFRRRASNLGKGDPEINQEDHIEHPDGRMDILGLAGADHADRIDDEAKRDTIGDGIAQHHDDDGHKGCGSDHHIFPVDRLQLLRHHDADHDQCRCGDRIGDRAQDQR